MTDRVVRLHERRDLRLETAAEPASPEREEALVRVGAGGICGSDLHYYQDGGFGPVAVCAPLVLGHEIAGHVVEVGAGVTGLAPGTIVAVDPRQPCGECRFCREGETTHCLEMEFLGSAMRVPHTDGGFRDSLVVPVGRLAPLPAGTGIGAAACAEPLAVALHAAARAGDLAGRRVLVTGAGPIGALCVAAARRGGAREVVVTDLHDIPLSVASDMGATRMLNLSKAEAALSAYEAGKGYFDLAFECSAAPASIASALAAVRPRGRIVQVGLAGGAEVPLSTLVGKEIDWVGTQRFQTEFAEAARLIGAGAIDVSALITHSFAPEDLEDAFKVAGDRRTAVKVQLDFAT